MSTFSGISAKGEKAKSKYQSLDINNLYKVNKGESLDTHQQKSTAPRRHGMQTLGKVPNARRAPANLPSLKSEHSGNDPAVSLVPSGGTGWGSKPGETNPSTAVATPTTQTPAVSSVSTTTTVVTTTTCSIAPVAVVTSTAAPSVPPPPIPAPQPHVDKSWSAIMSNTAEPTPNFLAHQSPFFQQEFPSLSGADSAAATGPTKTDPIQYGPGPSLRPQTEGSWMQGGSRPQGQMGAGAGSPQGTALVQGPLPPGIDVAGVRSNLAQSGVAGVQEGPVPQPPTGHMNHPPHLRGVMPPFMYRGNFPGNFPPNFQNTIHGPRPRFPPYPPPLTRFMQPSRPTSGSGPVTVAESEEVTPRPIIKEEDLNRMDDIARDVGWATHDDIDYNQKLAFSDEEGGQEDESSRNKHSRSLVQAQTRESEKRLERDSESCEREDRTLRVSEENVKGPSVAEPPRVWQQPRPGSDFRGPGPVHHQQMRPQQGHPSGRPVEEEEVWRERRRITEEVAIAVERAKQRKEEEEKRFEETRQAAAKKLQMLEEKLRSKSTTGEKEDTGTSSQSSSANTTPGVNIPIPDWEKEKDRDRSRTSSEGKEEKSASIPSAGENFRQMTQLDSRNPFSRERERERDRELRGERDSANQQGGQAAFSRHFQSNLPPRFQKQQAEQRPPPTFFRQSSGGSPQPPSQSGSVHETRWQNQNNNHYSGTTAGNAKGRRNRTESEVSDREREDDRIGKDNNRDRRDRNTPDYERDRYRVTGRDRDRGMFENSWKSGSGNYFPNHDGPDYNRAYHEYDNKIRERDNAESEDRRDTWERDKENRVFDEHRDSEKKYNDVFVKPRTPVQEDPFDKKETQRDNRHDGEKREREVMERRASDRDRVDQLQRPDSRDRPERPQRPDSRDSRASRESIRDDSKYVQDIVNDREFSWADTPFETEFKEEKTRRKDYREESRRDVHQSYHQRHIPGPITREKLEASDRSEPQRLVPLVKSDKKAELKKSDAQKDASDGKSPGDTQREQAWQHHSPPPSQPTATPPQSVAVATEPESWADAIDESASVPLPSFPQPDKPISNEQSNTCGVEVAESADNSQQNLPTEEHIASKSDHDEIVSNHKMEPHREREKASSRGNRGVRQDSRSGRSNWNSSFAAYRGSWNQRVENRSRRGGITRGTHRSNSNQEWRQSESEVSGDEISASTESVKEERERRQDRERKVTPRSPKQGARKSDKENRNREARRTEGDKGGYSASSEGRRYDKRSNYENKVGSSGFAPRGEPSRRGRGGFKNRESASNVGRRMDGYGPPPSKSPFASQQTVSEDKKTDNESDKTQLSTQRKEDSNRSAELNTDDPIKMNQQLLSAGIIAREYVYKFVGPHHNSKKLSSVPPRMQRKSESDRRERSSGKSKDDVRKGSRSVAKGGTVRSDPADENWETASDNSDQEDAKSYEQRQQFSSNKHPRGTGGTRRTNMKSGPGEKRNNGLYDREHDRSNNTNQNSFVNGRSSGSNNKLGPGASSGTKDQTPVGRTDDGKFPEPSSSQTNIDNKKPGRQEKEKTNNFDRIDLNNIASVVIVDDQPEVTMEEENSVFATDNGFQEVRSKKNVKEANRQLKEEVPSKASRGGSIGPKEQRVKQVSGGKPSGAQSPGPVGGPSPSPAAASPQNDPPSQNTSMKSTFDRPRTNKLPPRLAKQRENNRLQKVAQQQQQQHHDTEMNKVNQNVGLFPMKELSNPAPPPAVNAWDKPITATLRTASPPLSATGTIQLTPLSGAVENCGIEINEHTQSGASSQRSSPSAEKALSKVGRETIEKTVLDGTSPPVQTIIFENTNYKSSPADLAMKAKFNNHMKNQRIEKGRERKIEEDPHSVSLGFKTPGAEVKDGRSEPIQMPMSFNKNEDNADMKLDFSFDSELSQLTDDKTSKSMGIPRSMHMVQSSTADLNFKIASVKKVWENEASVLEHHTEDGIAVSTSSSFTPSFGNSVEDAGHYVKAGVAVVDSTGVVQVDGSAMSTAEVVYNNGPQMQNSANNYTVAGGPNMIKNDPNSASSNVCKVKPQPQAVMSAGGLGEHVHTGPLSPPPGTFTSSNAQPSGQHINYQPTAGHYSGMSVPSPPAMLFNSSQQMPTQGELYQAFQLGSTQMLGGQGRSQFSPFPHYSLSQGLSQTSAFSQQSVYLHQTAPPPNGAPPDMFQSQLSQYRIQPPPSYGTSQPLNSNPNTVLISSNSNSLMSANVKPSTQQIGAIGSKGSYPSAQHSQLYISYDPGQMLNVNQSYLSNSPLVPQRPANVPAIPPSSSYYSANTAGQTGFYPPGNSSIQAAQAAQPLHQTTPFGIQGYTTQSPAAAPVGMQSFGSQFLSNPLQMAQQYRTSATSFLKSGGADPSKSPQQDILNSVFSSATQVSSPKSRASGAPNSGKQSEQPSPTQGHHKFPTYQNATQANQLVMQQQQQQQVGGRSAQVGGMNVQAQAPFYPSPIQRPVAFQQAIPAANTNMMSGRHRVPSRPPPSHVINKIPSSAASNQYYSSQNNGVKLENNGIDSKVEGSNNKDCKMNDSATASKSSNAADQSAEDNTPTTD